MASPISPTMGRIVYFNKPNGLQRAAIITMVRADKRVNLTVFESDGETYGVHGVEYGDQGKAGTWCWGTT